MARFNEVQWNAMTIIKNLERILKVYYPKPKELNSKVQEILLKFEDQGYLRYSLTGRESLILLKDERDSPYKLRKYRLSPFPFVTNLELFSTTVGEWHQELLDYGIKSRLKSPEGQPTSRIGTHIFLIENHNVNSSCNWYLKKQYRRLESYRETSNYTAYWNLSLSLLRHSWSFKIACLNNWQPTWYKTLTLQELKKIFRNLIRILDLEEMTTTITNVWIESPKGKWRQLGVPGKAWRWYLHMLNMFISYLYDPVLSPAQYDGFIFNRGTKSWWVNTLWSPLLDTYGWIIEADIASGFPNLQLEKVYQALKEGGKIPDQVINLILTPLFSKVKRAASYPTLTTFIEDMENERWRNSNRSVHMGLGISPILFVITLDWALKKLNLLGKDFQYKFYADDGSFYFTLGWLKKLYLEHNHSISDYIHVLLEFRNPIISYLNSQPILRESGIQFCEQKSHFVRIQWLWTCSFNSLGLSLYSPLSIMGQLTKYILDEVIELKLRGNTRGRGYNPKTEKASTLPSRKELESIGKSGLIMTLEKLKRNWRKYFGLILSKLYGGQPNKPDTFKWKDKVSRKSLLGTLLRRGLNKSLSKSLRWTEYNSGSRCNKLLLGSLRGDHESRWVTEFGLDLERGFLSILRNKKGYRLLYPLTVNPITNPDRGLPEDTYFRKISEIRLSPSKYEYYKMKYEALTRLRET